MPDHRALGRELDVFDGDPLLGSGLPFWLPAGAAVRHTLEEYVRAAERRAGFQHVYSPVLGKRELYEISGHWSHYRDDMFPPLAVGVDEFGELPAAEEFARRCDPLRAEVAGPANSLAARIRAARLVPYQVVIGPREAAAGSAALRLRTGRRLPAQPAGSVVAGIRERVARRAAELWSDDAE